MQLTIEHIIIGLVLLYVIYDYYTSGTEYVTIDQKDIDAEIHKPVVQTNNTEHKQIVQQLDQQPNMQLVEQMQNTQCSPTHQLYEQNNSYTQNENSIYNPESMYKTAGTYMDLNNSMYNTIYNGYNKFNNDIITPDSMQYAYLGPNDGSKGISGNQIFDTMYDPILTNNIKYDHGVRDLGLNRSLDGSFFKYSRTD